MVSSFLTCASMVFSTSSICFSSSLLAFSPSLSFSSLSAFLSIAMILESSLIEAPEPSTSLPVLARSIARAMLRSPSSARL